MRLPRILLTRRLSTLSAVTLLAVAAILSTGGARAGEVKIAVAANFTQAAKDIALLFERETGHKVVLSFGSTGQIYTQIAKGAPFEVFLAADRARPQKAGTEGLGIEQTRFTYATGKIVLYSRNADLIEGPSTLKKDGFSKIAIANPVTAPYGAAAVQAMEKLGVYAALKDKIVQGNNIAQTHQFVQSGNAELGFVAFSQIATHDEGSRWPVPQTLYTPIAQDAILLTVGKDNPAARAFLRFLGGPAANKVKEAFGYGVGEPPKTRPDA
ncbi:MAG: molybdate ABC transporter substrate-binding protein [Rhodospirillaceae bacterium]|nr:molybdate ABC transporter substrate-binding protein [Rhodospirillaceae bacterium]